MRSRPRHAAPFSRPIVFVVAAAVLVVLAAGLLLVPRLEARLTPPVQNAGQQLTAYNTGAASAQVFMNGRWHKQKDVRTVLLIGIDTPEVSKTSGSYNNSTQADFLALLVHDKASGDNAVIHINRDTMTDITVLGVTGAAAGTRHAQLALAYNYGPGGSDSSRNTVKAVSHLLYGAPVDHYVTLAMDAVPILNDWAGGVTVEVQEDFTGIDPALIPGATVTLRGQQALTYVRARYGMEDSTNVQRMERQKNYASRWFEAARLRLDDPASAADLLSQMSGYHETDCTAAELTELIALFGQDGEIGTHGVDGESVRGEEFMEFHADEAALQQLVLELFYAPV